MRGGVVNPTSTIVRLSGAQARYRFIRGETIEIIARLPEGADPQQLELFYFEVRGKLRLTYLQRYALPNPEHRRNTLPFRYSKQPDGQWKLRPLEQLPPGEYCFSPNEAEDSFCFGVDEKAVTTHQ